MYSELLRVPLASPLRSLSLSIACFDKQTTDGYFRKVSAAGAYVLIRGVILLLSRHYRPIRSGESKIENFGQSTFVEHLPND